VGGEYELTSSIYLEPEKEAWHVAYGEKRRVTERKEIFKPGVWRSNESNDVTAWRN